MKFNDFESKQSKSLSIVNYCQFLSCFPDVPSPPGRPSILEKSSRTAKISWSPSQTDNNSPIMHYSVNVM